MPNEVTPWLLDGLGGVILGVIVTCLVLHLQSQKRVLTYEVELMPVFRALRGFDDLIQVKYDDVLVDNLYSCRVVVRNSGTVPLSDQPVLIQLEENVTVLEERFETKPALEFGEIRVDEEASNEWRRRYKVELINPGDEISVDLTVAGDLALSDTAIAARGGGLKCLPERFYASRQALYRLLCYLVVALLGIGFVVTPIGLTLRWSLPPGWAQVINVMATLWKGALGILLGSVFPLAVELWRRKNRRKRLSYEIIPPRPVFTTRASHRRRLCVEYKGTPVHDLYTCQVVLRNRGGKLLENQSVLVWLRGANILDASVHTEPELEFGQVRLDDTLGKDKRRYHFSQFESGDTVTIDLTVEGRITPEDVQVAARGVGLEIVSEEEWSTLASLLKKVTFRVTLSALGVLLLLLLNLCVLFAPILSAPAGEPSTNYLRQLATFVYDWLGQSSAEPGFRSGVAIGIVGFALTAFVVFIVRVWWEEVTAPYKPRR